MQDKDNFSLKAITEITAESETTGCNKSRPAGTISLNSLVENLP